MLDTTLTFRMQSEGADRVKTDVEGIGKTTEKTGVQATKSATDSSRAGKAFEAQIAKFQGQVSGFAKSVTGDFNMVGSSAVAGVKRYLSQIDKLHAASAAATARAAAAASRNPASFSDEHIKRTMMLVTAKHTLRKTEERNAASARAASAAAVETARARAEAWGMYFDSLKTGGGTIDNIKAKFASLGESVKAQGGAMSVFGNALKGAGKVAAGAVASVAALAAGLGAITSKVFDLAAAGEKGNQIAAAFKGGEEAMKGLRAATQGLATDQSLMMAANSAEGFGLEINNTEKLMKIAGNRALALGRDVNESVTRIINGTVRGSNELLEELTIRIPPVKQIYEDFAKKAGISTDAMTESQKRNAVALNIIASEQEALTATADKQNTAVARAQVQYSNFISTMQGFVAGTLASSGALDSMVGVLDTVSKLFEENKEVVESLVTEGIALLVEGFGMVIAFVKPLIPALLPLMQLFKGLVPILQLVSAGIAHLIAISIKVIDYAFRPLAAVLSGLISALATAAKAVGMDGLASQLGRAAKGLGTYATQIKKVSASTAKHTKEADKNAAAITSVGAAAVETAGLVGGLATSQEDLLKAFGSSAELDLMSMGLKEIKVNGDDAGKIIDNFYRTMSSGGGAMTDAQKANSMWGLAMRASGRDVDKASLIMTEWMETVDAAAVAEYGLGAQTDSVRASLGGLGDELEKIEAVANKPKKKGKGNGDARKKLIYEAELIGMTELQQEVAEVNKSLAANLKIAGRNAKAVEAAHVLAMRSVGGLMVQSMASTGEDAASAFGVAFTAKLDEWRGRRLRQTFAELFEATQTGITDSFGLLGETMATAGQQMDSFSVTAATALLEVLPNAFNGASAAIAGTRSEFDALAGHFSGDAEDGAMAGMLRFATGMEEITMSLEENLGSVTEGLWEFGDAMSAMGDNSISNAEATKSAFSGLSKAATGSIAIGRAATGAFITDKKKLAKINGIFEIAEAVQAAASLNFVGAAMHGLAAVKYFALSGGGGGSASAGKGSSTKQRSKRQKTELAGAGALLDRRNKGPSSINQYFFSVLDQRAPGEAVANALNRAARYGSNASIPQRMISAGNVQGDL